MKSTNPQVKLLRELAARDLRDFRKMRKYNSQFGREHSQWLEGRYKAYRHAAQIAQVYS